MYFTWDKSKTDGQLSQYFKRSEFSCKCELTDCKEQKLSELLLHKLIALREDYGKPICISSGYRCKEHNLSIGGAKLSQHILGHAADIIRPDNDKDDLALFAQIVKRFKAIGIADTFYHVDIRTDQRRRWHYPNTTKRMWPYQ